MSTCPVLALPVFFDAVIVTLVPFTLVDTHDASEFLSARIELLLLLTVTVLLSPEAEKLKLVELTVNLGVGVLVFVGVGVGAALCFTVILTD